MKKGKYNNKDILTVKFKDKVEERLELRKEIRRVRKLYLWMLKWNGELLIKLALLKSEKKEV